MKKVIRLFILLATFLATTGLGAQRPSFYKMSPLVREACRSTMKATQAKRVRGLDNRVITAFVKLNGNDSSVLSDNGCKILTHYGSLYIAEIPLSALGRLSADSRIVRIEAGRGKAVQMDTTGIIVGATDVNEGIDLPMGYTGKGVVVGVQDIGFDLTHPTFYSSDMSDYRIKAMWDQLSTDTVGSQLPVGRDYIGKEALLAIQHPRDGNDQSHGTHTTGIAAGSGAEGDGAVSSYRGIAYDADICLVCNVTSNDAALLDEKDYYKYTYALDALGFKYIFDYADSVGKPCVINFSEGSSMDFRGDDKLYYEMLDSLVGPGHIIVASSGNTGNNITYIRKDEAESSDAVTLNCGDDYAVATTRSRSDFTMGITNASYTKEISLNAVLASPDSILTDTLTAGQNQYVIEAAAYNSCFNDSDIICDWKISADTTVSQPHSVSFDLSAQGDGLVELFPAYGYFSHADGHRDEGDNAYSINSPGSAPAVISVGYSCYRKQVTNYLGNIIFCNDTILESENGERMMFSSVGPTFDGRIKPDVMAPGQNIISAYSSFYQENHPEDLRFNVRRFDYDGRTYGWCISGGSSMSAPVVTGVIALWLQANSQLTPEDCLDIFAKTCKHIDTTLSYPNNYYGYGQIDAAAGIKVALEKVQTGIKTLTVENKPDNRIYTIDGRFAGNDTNVLPHGLYIRNGKKFVK